MLGVLLGCLVGTGNAQSSDDAPAMSAVETSASPGPGPTPRAPSAAETETWLGVLSVLGSRKVPLLGKVDFQTDTFVLAQVTRSEGGWDVVQSTCRVAFPRTMGAQILIDPDAFGKIPRSTFSWDVAADGSWSAGPWASGWSQEDHDGDGEPGITLEIRAPFCGGELYASSEASQRASGRPKDGLVVSGDITVHVIQKTLGTKGPCLSLMARDSDETMNGRFAFAKAPAGTTCASDREWPRIDW